MAATAALDHSIVIAAAPKAVWAMISDLTRMGEWSPHSAGARMGALGAMVRAVTGTTDVVAEVDRSIRTTLAELKAAAERSP